MAMADTRRVTITPAMLPATLDITAADHRSASFSRATGVMTTIEIMTVIDVTRATAVIAAIIVDLMGLRQQARRPGIRHQRRAFIPLRRRERTEVAITAVTARQRTKAVNTAVPTELW
jgi:hypothetical protein